MFIFSLSDFEIFTGHPFIIYQAYIEIEIRAQNKESRREYLLARLFIITSL